MERSVEEEEKRKADFQYPPRSLPPRGQGAGEPGARTARPAPSPAPPTPRRRRRVPDARGPAGAGVSRGGVRDDWASRERNGGEGSSEVTHWLCNNRTDKLQGTRRSQARVSCRRRPDVPRGPPGSESIPRASQRRVRSCGAGRGRLCSGRDTAAPRSSQSHHGVPLPLTGPQLPAAPSPHPTTSIKVHFGRESGLGLPLAPPGGSAHFAPRELSDPGRGGGFRAWPPLPPGAGWRSPRIELVGLLRRTFFSLRQPQHRARLGSGSLRAGKSPGLTPSSPVRSRRLRRGSGASGGGGEEPTGTGRGRRAAGGQSRRWGEADRSGWGGAGGTRRHPVRQGRAASEEAWSGPREMGGSRRGASPSPFCSGLSSRRGAAETQQRAHLDPLPRPPSPRPQES
ncbi:unnamed protein product [Rangifer tarandus platyrhynchus]|uniref:Uncharacterized protein n=2 Tax=Rangifer tarandus platyrhynchus TaxID=3082113 RepID=A0ACB0FCJ5_RANTA|nr:unnamed protein product [Rangifer tarandus platyrhynchus]